MINSSLRSLIMLGYRLANYALMEPISAKRIFSRELSKCWQGNYNYINVSDLRN